MTTEPTVERLPQDTILTDIPTDGERIVIPTQLANGRQTTPIDRVSTEFENIDFSSRSNMIYKTWAEHPVYEGAIVNFRPELNELFTAFEKGEVSTEDAKKWLEAKYGEGVATAGIDGLTELSSRGDFEREKINILKKDQRNHKPTSAIMVDMDDLKTVNDGQGHSAGDEFIKDTAQAIRESVRSTDLAARYGGDEIAVFLSDSTLEQATTIADRISTKTKNLNPQGRTISIGLAEITYGVESELKPEEAAELLIKMADDAVYVAKVLGKNRIVRAYKTQDSNVYYEDLSTGEGYTMKRDAGGKPKVTRVKK